MQFGLQKTIDGCFRLITSFILLLFPCLVSEAQTTESDNRSNVLFLVVDDLNTWLLNDSNRYTGKVIAPNIRKLANSGVNFTRAYTASPKCSPSRTAVFSGIAPWKSGLWENGQDIDESKVITSVTHLAKFFREHGYYTGKSGKITHGYDQQGNWDEVNRGKNISTRTASPLNAPLNGWAKSKSGKPTETDWGPTHRGEEDMYDTQHAN
ncbi:MAG: sulfatase-like hydrolase/transferase, partial [Verrucomicrobiae bacterium]|nr:sulfatase-like hydrolase/transferase [Verrucomicrobiae bacterium]